MYPDHEPATEPTRPVASVSEADLAEYRDGDAPLARSSFVADPHAPLTVWLVDQPECEPYDKFIRTHPDRSLYHTLAWQQALQQDHSGEALTLVALRGGIAVGVWPLFAVQPANAPPALVSLPNTPQAGLLSTETAAAAALRDRVGALARERGINALIVSRWLSPAAIPAGASVAPHWIRVSPTDLVAYADSPEAPPTHTPNPGAPREVDCSLIDTPSHGPSRAVDGLLTKLAAAKGHPGRLMTRNEQRQPVGMAVWLKQADVAYLLGYRVVASDAMARELIGGVARRLLHAGCTWVDLPLPAAPCSWLAGLRHLPSTQLSAATAVTI